MGTRPYSSEMKEKQELRGAQAEGRGVLRRDFLTAAGCGALGFLAPRDTAEANAGPGVRAIVLNSTEDLLNRQVSPADALSELLTLFMDLTFDILGVQSERWAKATDRVVSLLEQLEALVRQLVAAVPALERASTIQHLQQLTGTGQVEAALLTAEPPSHRLGPEGLLATLNSITQEVQQQQIVLTGPAVRILEKIRRLVLQDLSQARVELAAAKTQYEAVAEKLRARLEQIRKRLVYATLEISQRLDPGSVRAEMEMRVADPVQIVRAAAQEIKALAAEFGLPYNDALVDDPRSVEVLVDGLNGAAYWAEVRLRRPAAAQPTDDPTRSAALLAVQTHEPHSRDVKTVLAVHCPPGTNKRAQDLVCWVGPFWAPFIPVGSRKGRIRAVLMRTMNCPHLRDLQRMTDELAGLAPSFF